MNSIDNFNLSFAFSPIWFISCALVAALIVYFYYKFTIPAISITKRTILGIFRFTVLFLLLLLIFEPVLTIEHRDQKEPVTFVFLDNSASITNYDSAVTILQITEAAKFLSEEIEGQVHLLKFDESVQELSPDSLNTLQFDGRFTNFENVSAYLKKSGENVNGVIIVTDGNINQGVDPLFEFTRQNLPVFTIGVGDTSEKSDVELNRVFVNSFIYAGTETQIEAVVFNSGFENSPIQITLWNGKKPVEVKTVTLSAAGINRIKFAFTPDAPGEKRMHLTASVLDGESTKSNNTKYFNLTVLKSKLKILVISGAIHPDVAAVRNSLIKNENYKVASITEAAPGKYLETFKNDIIDSADVFILLGYPGRGGNDGLFETIKSVILNKEKPVLFQFTEQTDVTKLRELENILPFEIKAGIGKSSLVQLEIKDVYNPVWGISNANLQTWNSLPPAFQSTDLFKTAPGAKILADAKIRNISTGIPLIVSRKIGKRRAIAILASGIYKWKLRPGNSTLKFDELIQNSVKWLSNSNRLGRFKLSSDKKIYSAGEPVVLRAEVYDESFNPQNGADIKISYGDGNSVLMNSAGSGIYEGILNLPKSGEYQFNAEAYLAGNLIGRNSLKIKTAPINYEKLKTGLNDNFLKLISNETGGYYLYINALKKSIDRLNQNLDDRVRIDRSTEEIYLWSFEIMLALLIVLLAAEWYERKRSGLL